MKLYVDLHIHSCLSPCGDMLMTPNNIVGMAYLKGLDAIAVCDHNSAGNLEAIGQVAQMMGVLLLPGLELNTREEVHLLCYFKSVPDAQAFGREIYAHLPVRINDPALFGAQVLMNVQDEPVGQEDRLLIQALDLPLEQCCALCREFGGACVPAHINRGANGVLGALGFLPEQIRYDALEIAPAHPLPEPYGRYLHLHASDAHYLEDISERNFALDVREKTVEALFDAIKRAG